jgi:pyruvate dehydrogenase E1 component alpha subunit
VYRGGGRDLAGESNAWADGDIAFWAKDLPNDKLTEMFTTIVRIRWHERTMADKMITDPK